MMTIESAESVEFQQWTQEQRIQEQRAELRAVLGSRDFVRAPKLANLLSYLCERLFAGEAHQIKEYSIGLEVFNRGETFDQDSDSIVRVEANRLRRRLADYYAGEGASHKLQITIPVGQYVPKFVPGVQPPAQNGLADSALAGEAQTQTTGSIRPTWRQWLSPAGPRPWWIVAAFAAVVLGIGIGYPWLLIHLQRTPATPPAAATPPAEIADLQFGPPSGDEIRILAGATRSFVDHAGKLWSADVAFTGGTAVKSSIQHIWRTPDPDFYRTSRQGQFRYDIPLKKGIYELRLHFAETVYGPESTGTGGEGSRIMTVRANSRPILANFDVVADSGASRTADVKVFPDITPASDGQLHLEFAGDDGKQATLAAIEILPGVRGHMRPVRILARQTPYYSNDSHWWSPDNYFEGGELASYPTPVNGTDDPELYETERWGNFSYAIPVPPGKYALTLLFAVHRSPADQAAASGAKPAVAHVFNVFCNGKSLLQNFDLLKEARENDVLSRRIPGLEPNAQGKLLLSFVPVEGYASVTGIEVLAQ
jgi:Malectin domain